MLAVQGSKQEELKSEIWTQFEIYSEWSYKAEVGLTFITNFQLHKAQGVPKLIIHT